MVFQMSLLAEAARVRRQRRRSARQQAGRLARTTKVARELSAAQIREQAVQECQESANAAAAQEVSVAQSSGLMAIADALNRLSEQNLMLHTQTQLLMSRLAPAAAEAPGTAEMYGLDTDWQTPEWLATEPQRRRSPSPSRRQTPY